MTVKIKLITKPTADKLERISLRKIASIAYTDKNKKEILFIGEDGIFRKMETKDIIEFCVKKI